MNRRSGDARLTMRTVQPSPRDVGLDTPLRLKVAAALAYPDGSMTASGLRREAARGRLVIERTAGKDYTTLANIDRMRELCRVQPKEPACGFAPKNDTPMAGSARAQYGSSETDRAKSARAALQWIAKAPSASLSSTLRTSISQTAGAAVIRPKS